jgi:hypothetical protein
MWSTTARSRLGGAAWLGAMSLVAASLVTAPIAAQGRTGTVMGVVKDEGGVPIPFVEVGATKVSHFARTDSVGKFTLSLLPAGMVDMTFRRIGYSPFVVMIEVPEKDTTEVEVKLSGAPQNIATLVIQDDAPVSKRLERFEAHRKSGAGHFVTRADILKRNPMLLSDMLRSIPGTVLVPTGISGRSVLRFTRTGVGCPPQYYVDGVMITAYNIDEMPVHDVEAIELYSGIAGLPPEYARSRGNRDCGTVAIWTRIPGK